VHRHLVRQEPDEPFGGGPQLARTAGWALEDGAEMAFKAMPTARATCRRSSCLGVITLGGRPRWATPGCGIELLWGEADWPVHRYADNLAEGQTSREFFWTARDAWGPVWLEPQGKLSLPTPPWEKAVAAERPEGPVKIAYTLPKDQRVTLAIDDAGGRRVRNLLAAAERKAGANTDLWTAWMMPANSCAGGVTP